ncbi:syringopeptin non-ribosomal peptide synthetase SypA, partial [Pseudomonas syringae]
MAFVLTAAQRNIWLDQMTQGDSPLYNIGGYVEIEGPFDSGIFQRAVDLLIEKHDALRMVLLEERDEEGVPMQTFATSMPMLVTPFDLQGRDDPRQAAEHWMQTQLEQPFKLEGGPLFRVHLLKLEAQRFYFVIHAHHIALDGWGIDRLCASVSELYSVLHDQRVPDLAAPSYVDFIKDDRQYRESPRFALDQAYWLDKYRDIPDPLLAPRHQARIQHPATSRSGHLSYGMDRGLEQQIEELALRLNASSFHVHLAVLYVYFTRACQRDELVIGLPILNRSTASYKKTLGLFTQLSSVRLKFSPDLTFAELVQGICRAVKQDYRHQRFPVSDLNSLLELRRAERTQLFDLTFSYERQNQLLRFGQASARAFKCSNNHEQTPLAIHLRSNACDTESRLHYIYNEAYFQHDEIVPLAERLQQVTEQGLANEQLPVHEFSLISKTDALQIQTWNAGQPHSAEYLTIHQQFEARAAERPDAVALMFEGQTLSYGGLNARANKVAHRLLAQGVRPDDRVAICVERGPAMIIGLLGILKSGAGYVPLDPAYPLERLAYTLGDSAPVALLSQQSVQQALPVSDVPLIYLDDVDLQDERACNPQVAVKPSDLAYVIYTSGSTGLPKGVMVEHRNVARLFSATRDWFGFNEQDIWALFHSFAFDFSVWEIWGALLHGGRLLIVPQLVSRSPEDFHDLLCSAGVTVLNQTPSAFRQLIAAQGEKEQAHSLRQVIFGGEALDTAMLKPWYARSVNADTQLVNMYGITETTVHVTYYPLQPEDAQRVGASPIGKRIPDLQLYLLDAYGHPLPPGAVGELYVGGAGVARGYLNRDELNATRFLDDPFASEPGARMYRSGDLGRWLPDGSLEYLGRNDEQVKIRGFRIELGEIEAQLSACQGVREAVVVVREDEPGDKRLVAYVIGTADLEPDATYLREQLRLSLAEHMLPSAFVSLQAFPLTANGKLDRKALPLPSAEAYARRQYEAPQGLTETRLAGLWTELLGVEQVGRHDQFFELGGHSMLAVKLIERMRDIGLNADVRVLFGQPTLASLAAASGKVTEVQAPTNKIPAYCRHITPDMLPLAALTQAQIDRVVASVPGGVSNVQDIYGLVPLQEGILYHHLANEEGDPYLLQALLRVDSFEQLLDFTEALQQVIDRHDILRTAVAWEELDEPVQVVWRQARLRVEAFLPHPDQGDVAAQLQAQFDPRRIRMDLHQAPMMRLHYAEDPVDQSWVAVLLFHHLIDDATSLALLGAEIDAFRQGRGEHLPASVPYRNHVAQARLSVSREEHEAFFRDMLADVDEPTLPFGLQDVQGDGSGVDEALLPVEPKLAGRLRAHARRLGVSNASLHHLACAQVVGRLSGRQDVVFGTVLMGRLLSGQGAERALGMFINTLPLRVAAGEQGIEAAVRTTHARLAALVSHEHAPLSLAQGCSGVAAPTPLFSALMNYRHVAVGAQTPQEAGQTRLWGGVEVLGGEERTNYPLSLSVDDLGESFGLTVQAVAGIDARRICGYMHTVLEQLADALDNRPDAALHSLDWLPAHERRQLLEDFNAFDSAYPQDLLLHQLFEAQAAAQPDSVAVTYEGQRLSYAELNQWANQIAHRLIAAGVGADDRVAICVERSLEMIAGLVGILKAGAGYVPLDPSYPEERLAYMLEDSAPKMLLTQRGLRERFAQAAMPVLLLEAEARAESGIDRAPATNPQLAGLGAQHLAYLIYTSGSTGQPKGVAMPHAPLVNLMHWQIAQSVEDRRPRQRTLQFAALGFDVAFQEIFSTLCAGGELSLIHADTRLNFRRLFEHICEQRIERLYMPCIALQALAEAVVDEPKQPECLLQDVITAGEQLRITEPMRQLFARLSDARLHNHYGPTESHVVTALTLDGDPQAWPTLPNIGQPVANTRIYLLDEDMRPVPVGVAGELYIGGASVARGYLNRDDLTAERFIADPFASNDVGNPHARLYKTGDLACWQADGRIVYLGRNDDQIKVRGFRIELGEIEARLGQYPGLRDTAVLAREDVPGEKRLVAYFSVQAGQVVPQADQMRLHLQALLPDYMIPAAYVHLEKLPVSPNGKLDRRVLPQPSADAFVSRDYQAPLGDTETTLAALWCEVLSVERVGRQDHFFELGGHSLLAVKLIERMRQAGLSADVRVLFGQPTLAALAAAVGGGIEIEVPANGIPEGCRHITPDMLTLTALDQASIERIVAGVPGGAANVQDIYPLAPLQEGILYHHIAAEQGDPYLLQATFALRDPAHVRRFAEGLQAMIDRHDILRTALVWEDLEHPLQVALRRVELSMEQITLAPDGADIVAELQRRFDPRECRLDLSQAPLIHLAFAEDSENQRWVAILLFHHIALDHTALDVMSAEMLAHLQGTAAQLPPAMPYRNYVGQARLGVSREQHEAFFREMLGDVDEPTLPFGLLEVQGDGQGVKEVRHDLPADLCQRLRTQARQLGVSAASLHHLAWARVLGAASGREDVVFGTVLLGRMQSGLGADRALGMFINTLPLRVDVGTCAVRQAVRQTHARLTALLGHEHAPLVLAQRCSAVAAASPLFSALLNYRHSPAREASGGERWADAQVLGVRERTNYPLSLSVDDKGEGFLLSVQVAAGFDGQRICSYMQTALNHLVEALESAPDSAVRDLSVVPETESQQLLVAFNDTARDYPQQQTVHGLFEAQVRAYPEACAAIHDGVAVSYAELNTRANRLARHLLGLGVQPGDSVAILLERSHDLLASQLAVLKCAAVYVPLDVNAPVERQAFMVEDSQARVLLTRSRISLTASTQRVDLDGLTLDGLKDTDLALPQSSESVAYIMYTSGSTGVPKGVLVPHRAISRLVINNGYADFNAQDRVAFASNPAFDASTLDVWAPLLNGGCVVVIGQHDLLSPLNFQRLLLEQAVTVLWMTAGLFHQYASGLGEAFSRLRYLIVGGDVLDPAVIGRVLANNAPQHLLNGYGPTEATTFSATYEIVSVGNGSIPIGKPVGNTCLYVLDSQGQPVPLGVPGELYIGGQGVARGYLNRDELTLEKFVADPFDSAPQARLYRTGDLVRWRADGNLEYLGRNDDQVKIRGFRVELGEIEARLAEHSDIREAVVLCRQDEPGDKRLVAYVTAQQPETALDIEHLRNHLQGLLPDYMVPAAYVQLDALPLTANGKLDRKALPAPDAQSLISHGYEAPQGELETLLASIWADVLKVEQVGRHDHFFELGGHSLLAVTLIERMRQVGLSADVRVLFSQPTVAALAAAVGGGTEVVVPANLIPEHCEYITPELLPLISLSQMQIDQIAASVSGGMANVQDIYPLAPLQAGILYHHISTEGGDPYTLKALFEISDRTRLDAFSGALQGVINRHDILRTAVLWEGFAEPVQVVLRRAELQVTELLLDPADGPVDEQLHERFDPRHYRLDVRHAPLMRIVFSHDPLNGRWLAMLLFHHMAIDHVALEVLKHEIQSGLLGEADALAASVPVPYRNYVAQARLGVSQAGHETFFRKMLGDIEEPTLPFGLQDVQGDGRDIEGASLTLDARLDQRLRAQARQQGVSAASLVHLAWGQVLANVSSKCDVVFGTVLMGRMQSGEGADRAMGMFINTLPLRVDVGAITVVEGLKTTHERLTALLGHEHAPLVLAQRCSGVAAPLPLFSALLNYRHSAPGSVSERTAQAWEGIYALNSEERTNYPLTLNVDDLGEGFSLTALVTSSTGAKRVCNYMQMALETLVTALEQTPLASLQELSILPAEEREQLLVEFNNTALDYPHQQTIHGMFEVQVERTPDAVAVVHGEQRLSYRQLNEQANRLAHALRKQGVQPDSRVGICVERGVEMVVALLAILKAGGGYVPLDPAYPAERIAYMLQDSAPAAVLAHTATQGLLADISMPVINFDLSDWQDESVQNPQVAGLTSAHLAYLIYTSGSTGLPKGVMIEHRNTVNFLTWAHKAFDASVLEKTLFATSLNFDLAVYECLAPLTSGGRIEVVKNILELQHGEHDIGLINTVPSALKALLDVEGLPTSVHTVNVAGEALKRSLVENLFEKTGVQRLCNLYGPSETTTYSSWVAMDREDGFAPHIGKPVGNTQFYLLDERQQPVPLGVAGEIYIGGAGVARGYLNRDELTAERFLQDRFSQRPAARMYRTGDLGRYLPDGNIEYLGRNDDQVKLRGFRIELSEIEAVLATHPAVHEVALLVRQDAGEKRLVAYFTVHEAQRTLEIETLRSHLQTRLPDYMVPAAYVRLDALPLTTNGKLDRKALPEPDAQALISRGYEAPQGEVENLLATIWAEVLQVEQVGRHDHFFELGGHSLLAVSLIERMRQAGLSADVRVLFSQPTLAALAAAVGGGASDVTVPENAIPDDCMRITPEMLPLADLDQAAIDLIVASVPGGAANVQDIYPLAPLQEGILYHHLAAEVGDPYVLQTQFAFADRERLNAFVDALQSVIDRHDILRTAVLWQGLATPMQVVCRQALLFLEQVELDPADGQVMDQLQQRFDPRHSRLDMSQAPLLQLSFAEDQPNQRWVAILLFHHMVLDHKSMDVVLNDMQARLLGKADQLDAAIPYRNYVTQARLGMSREAHEAFFRELLGDIDEPTLPFGLLDVQGDGHDIEDSNLILDRRLTLRLRAQARQLGVSVASLVHLAWAQVLGKVSSKRTVVFGTVLMGRMQSGEGAERALGMFINTLPLRVDMAGQSARGGVRATHARLTALLGHEHAPLVLAQRCSGVAAPLPLFSALINYRHSGVTEPSDESIEAWRGIDMLSSGERTNYPLTLNVDDRGDSLRMSVLVTGKVGAGRVCGYMQTALKNLLIALEQSPDTALDSLPILPADECEQLLLGFNDTALDYPQQQTIHGLFEAQAERTPDALAVIHGEQRLTYRELNEQANRLAHALRKQGVQPDSRVGICVERSAEMVVGLLAILKAGGGYVPLDPAYPAERIAYMLQDSAPAAVLAQTATQGLLADVSVPVINLDLSDWQDQSVQNPQVPGLTSAHLAYLIYTSGSTGLPKGVMIEHRNTVNFLSWAHTAFDGSALEKTLFSTSLNFDLAVYECFAPLTSGGSIEVVKNVLELQHGEHDIGLINTVPSALKALLDVEGLPATVHTVNVAGEALKRSLVENLFEKTGVQRLCNLYGPSETTTYSSWVAMDREDGFAPHIGKPVGNTQFYLLDEQQQPVPLGVAGEIYIGGAGVARGYLNRDDLTAERFLKDPFSQNPAARMYRTGDLGRYLPDGNIEYLGRNDDQVKIRGFRIELGEIDARLAKHPAVHEAVVTAREDIPGDKRLVAYYTLAAGHTVVDIDSLRSHLQQRLPEYMVPAIYVMLDKLPLTPNGKLDRKALPAPDSDSLISRGYEAPQGETETQIAVIWQELLGVEQVGRHDNFFELGGHSLLAVSFIGHMRQSGLSVDVRALFGQPTLAALAAAIGGSTEIVVPANLINDDCQQITPELLPLINLTQVQIDQVLATVPGGVANVQDIYPLAPLQEGILYHHLSAETGDPYVLQTQFVFDDRERMDAFVHALQTVIDRHDILRTSVVWQGLDSPVQVVWRQARLHLEALELDPANGGIAEQLHSRFDPRHYRLDIGQAPLMRVAYAADPLNQRICAMLLFHHMALDHAALEVVKHEIQSCLLDEAEALAASVPVPYRNYVAQARLGVSQADHETFFRDMLGDIDEPTLPFGLGNVQGDGRDIEEASLVLDAQLNLRLRAQARQQGVSAASLVHLAWAQVLGNLSDKRDVVFGTVLMGRMQSSEGADRALGMFINTLPLRVDVGAITVFEGLKATHERLTALLGHEHAPLVLAQRCSGVAAPLPLFNALLNYRHSAVGNVSERDTQAWQGIHALSSEERTNYPLIVNVDDLGTGFRLNVQAVTGIDARRICAYMQTTLSHLVKALEFAADSVVCDLPVVPEAERQQLLVAFNDTTRDYPQQQTVQSLFEAQVRACPKACAAIHDGVAMSYAELNTRANRLARHLLGLGVQPGDSVAILLERSLDLLASQLAVLKCSAVYVPLDINAPVERQTFMIEDSQARVLLTHSQMSLTTAAQRVDLDNLTLDGLKDTDLALPQSSESVAYIMYTSGSTGTPKGVLVPHRAISRLVINNGYADFNA